MQDTHSRSSRDLRDVKHDEPRSSARRFVASRPPSRPATTKSASLARFYWRRRLIPGLLFLVAVSAVGVVGFIVIEEMATVDALYMVVITLSTVGFAEVHTLSTAGRVFTSVLIVAGVGTLAWTAANYIEYLAEGHLGAHFARRRRARLLSHMQGHYIVGSYGRVGARIAQELRNDGCDVVVIDVDPAQVQTAAEDGLVSIADRASSDAALTEAGIERAAAFIVATDDDAENVYAVLAARVLAPKVPVIARAASDEAVRRLQSAGAVRVFSPPIEGALSMVDFVRRPNVRDVLDQLLDPHAPGLDIREMTVPGGSELVGETVSALSLQESGISILALVRRGRTEMAPATDRALEAGDVFVVVGVPESLQRLFEHHELLGAQAGPSNQRTGSS